MARNTRNHGSRCRFYKYPVRNGSLNMYKIVLSYPHKLDDAGITFISDRIVSLYCIYKEQRKTTVFLLYIFTKMIFFQFVFFCNLYFYLFPSLTN